MGKFRKPQAMFWPVKVKLAKGKNKYDTEEIQIKFVRLSKDDLMELIEKVNFDDDADLSKSEKASITREFNDDIISYIVDWKIEEESGEPMEFNDENLDAVMNHIVYATAIIKGFWDFQNGGAGKN